MNEVSINDKNYLESDEYKKFKEDNPVYGYLKIRAYAASGAVPITELKVEVSKIIDNTKVIFYSGFTDESGIIERINLPTRRVNTNNLNAPDYTTYDILATRGDNINLSYKINVYENIIVVQNISIIPGGF